MPIIYSAVARGGAVLADYSVFAGNFAAVAKDYLTKASHSGRSSYTVDNHVFSFLAEDGFSERRSLAWASTQRSAPASGTRGCRAMHDRTGVAQAHPCMQPHGWAHGAGSATAPPAWRAAALRRRRQRPNPHATPQALSW